MKKPFLLSFSSLFASLLALASSASIAYASNITIDKSYVFASIPGSNNPAAFMSITNNTDSQIALIEVKNSLNVPSEIHAHTKAESSQTNSKTQNPHPSAHMIKIPKLEIQPHSQIELKPGGYHIMLIGLKQELKVGQEVDLELTFDNGETIELKQIKAIDRSSVLDTHKPHKQ
ncbi:copper chaperone PCu(A)C [uncultured Helicobacter sp.]|uniref:copper chaperone PCu(A)C n=1 Tax=uncultured Helicobacter sp. TaxID=175537 RepID=UPI00259A4EBB|nr:copper chaperone PCu(A)C [uncultured Helicobacter sp.]